MFQPTNVAFGLTWPIRPRKGWPPSELNVGWT